MKPRAHVLSVKFLAVKFLAGLLALCCAFGARDARAQAGSACDTANYLTVTEGELPHAREEIKTARKLTVVVVGTASSTLVGQDGPAAAYPARLEASLRRRLEGIEVKVVPIVQTRQTSSDLMRQFGRILADNRPSIVIWQTGTVDAIRGIDPEQLRVILSKGVDMIRAGGADPLFINMQYSPRTESMIAVSDYIDIMRIISQEKDVPLFDRYGIMRYWFDTRQFDLYARARGMALARRVHECIGRALSSLIIDTLPASSLGIQVQP